MVPFSRQTCWHWNITRAMKETRRRKYIRMSRGKSLPWDFVHAREYLTRRRVLTEIKTLRCVLLSGNKFYKTPETQIFAFDSIYSDKTILPSLVKIRIQRCRLFLFVMNQGKRFFPPSMASGHFFFDQLFCSLAPVELAQKRKRNGYFARVYL